MKINAEKLERALVKMIEDIEYGGFCESKITAAQRGKVQIEIVVTNEIDAKTPDDPIITF